MGWGRKIVELELLGEAVGREVAKTISPAPLRAPKIINIPDPYQSKVVETGQKDVTVYYFKVPKGQVCFLQRVGNNWFEDTYLKWRVDGRLVISPYINFELASPNNPLILEPWMRVNEEVKWTGTNNSPLSCHFEVFCFGIYLPLEDEPLLLKLGLPISQ